MEEKNIGEKLFLLNNLERSFGRKKLQNKMLLETVSEREREEHTEDRMGREIKKVMERWAHHLGMGYVPVRE